jgi:selenide,water dikinase
MSKFDENIPLSAMSKSSGCAAKLPPDALSGVLEQLNLKKDDNLIIGLENLDDAGVYKIDDKRAMVQSLDFFTPIVDDPYYFGQIAAANALSDIYAMGGIPGTGMNIVCFPLCGDMSVLTEILKGGADKLTEAGALLVGGHSIDDEEPKYGVSVTGFVELEKIKGNNNAQTGDLLILTKPIGLGVINTAIKGQMAEPQQIEVAVSVMTELNKTASEIMHKYNVHSCTDVTGFGLGGHSLEMAKASEKSLYIQTSDVPLIEGAEDLMSFGMIPAGTYRNKAFYSQDCEILVEDDVLNLIFDPQTSGGLLISVAPEDAEALLEELHSSLNTPCNIVGKVIEKADKALYLV